MLCFARILFNQRYELHFRPSQDSRITLSLFSKGNSFSTLKLGERGAYFQKSQYILWTIVDPINICRRDKDLIYIQLIQLKLSSVSSEGQSSKLKNLELQAPKEYWGVFIPYLLTTSNLENRSQLPDS